MAMDEEITAGLEEITKRIGPHLQAKVAQDMREFQLIRARTRGAIICAHHDIDPSDWTEADDRMLDLVTAWIDNLRER